MTSRRIYCTILIFLVGGSAVMYGLMPDSMKNAIWTQNVLRNWQDYGLLRLDGRLVYNPGGVGVLDQPQIYTGHRPFSLYPAYVVGYWFGGAGYNGLPYYLLLTGVVAAAVWLLLGKDPFALLVACALAFCPGDIRSSVYNDPLHVPVLLGLPALGFAYHVLTTKKIKLRTGVVLAAVIVLYSLTNWVAAFSFAIAAAALIATPRLSRRRLLGFCLLAAISGTAVTLISVRQKVGSGPGGQTGTSVLRTYFNAYLFGPGGYMGFPMTWGKAVLRLTVVNALGLLPLWVLFAWGVRRALKQPGTFRWSALWPVGMALASIAGMRNYFAHHPWMSASLIIVGLTFSLRLLIGLVAAPSDGFEITGRWRSRHWLFLGAAAVYCSLVLVLFRVNASREDALRSFIQRNTQRHDVILFSAATDPSIAAERARLSELCDRRFLEDNKAAHPAETVAKPKFHLTTVQQEKRTEISRMDSHESGLEKLGDQMLTWYRRNVARRAKNDQLETAPVYFLYSLVPPR